MEEAIEGIQEKEIHISDYIMVLLKRKVLIIAFFIIVVFITMLFTFMATPVYQSTAKLLIDKETSSSPITGERVDYESYMSQSMTFNTHFKLIKSLSVINKLIDSLKLDAKNETLEINPIKEIISRFKANIKILLKMEESELSLHEKRMGLITTVQDKIAINQVRDTRLLTIDVKDKDPVLAAKMSNTLAEKYIEFNLANKMESSTQTLEWLNNELYALRKKLEDAEKAFFEYKQNNKVFSITGKQKMVEQKMAEFNNKYLEARNKRLELDAKLNELSTHIQGARGVANVRSLVDNPMIDTIYRKIVDLELELTRLTKTFKVKHPKIVQLKSELEKSRNRLSEEIKKELANLKSERKVLISREKTLEKTISEFESDALDTSSKELKYTILQRSVNTSQNLYDLMVSRVKESNILQSSDASNIRLVEKAMVPLAPVSPNKKRNLLLSIVLGLFGGVGLAFFLEYLDQTVRTEEDIHTHFNLSVLSVIPEADKSENQGAGK
ncbi:GumC family protein [Desulfobacula toluolica]|uniref:Lipopolysaccharide biosynthesis protein n=1 Tax=Desulfobacula toluolica (strain DSM 7467 / Tol2) TaxID=651182 RepID=K0NGI6_DESTT|nr:GumC family protein [Desulfobacula toluolica]CCK78943.1 lipopolysaccharide biosynthesis protein [Desulfobacula toluolica Tol2]